MSCRWDLDLSVIGPESVTQGSRETLPPLKLANGVRLFHHVEIISSIPGFVIVHASCNYHGSADICELVERFPDLSFQRSLHSDVGYDHHTLFYGQSGETRKISEVGGSLRDVQQLAGGHASSGTTARYIEGDCEAQRKVVALI